MSSATRTFDGCSPAQSGSRLAVRAARARSLPEPQHQTRTEGEIVLRVAGGVGKLDAEVVGFDEAQSKVQRESASGSGTPALRTPHCPNPHTLVRKPGRDTHEGESQSPAVDWGSRRRLRSDWGWPQRGACPRPLGLPWGCFTSTPVRGANVPRLNPGFY